VLGSLADTIFVTYSSDNAETLTSATNAASRFIFDKANGQLYYDVDGNKAFGKEAVLFAILTGVTNLTADDLFIV
jgi:Ca2+-binding RTX toxin-like protein